MRIYLNNKQWIQLKAEPQIRALHELDIWTE